jgi:hypothetical protein
MKTSARKKNIPKRKKNIINETVNLKQTNTCRATHHLYHKLIFLRLRI